MCGIIAHVAFEDRYRISREFLQELNELQHHRGPDDGGVYLSGAVALASRRLSIVDVEGGHQPVLSQDGRYAIVFNGEIYNHEEIRQKLLSQGYCFKTRSDTETVLNAFIDRGPDCLRSFNGMFAFAIWDDQTRELFVARDRVGVKPLYFSVDGKRAMFSSELKPLHESELFPMDLDPQSISDYLAYWYVCEPRTIFKNISQLKPGHYAVVKNGKMRETPYWQMPCAKEINISFPDACAQLDDLLDDAVKIRIPQEVPFGTFLSGGIDSGLITALCARHSRDRLKAFSIGFKEESYSELPQARDTARRNKADLFVTQINAMTPAIVEEIGAAFDEPLGNASYVPTYLLAKFASQKVKVVLTGDGGDELFGGYPTYQAPYFQSMYRSSPSWLIRAAEGFVGNLPVSHRRISLDFRLKQFMRGASLSYPRAHYSWREVTPWDVQSRLFKPDVLRELSGRDPFGVADGYFKEAKALSVQNQLMYVDMKTYLLNDHLRKVDRMTMAHSLEARIPLLDFRIVEFAMRLPAQHKVTFQRTKRILKQVAKRYLPNIIINGKKKGLTSPIAGWLANDLRGYTMDALQGGIMSALFDPREIKTLLIEHQDRKKDHSRLLWALLALQVWHKNLNKKQVVSGNGGVHG
jgi:asparagine synthase (glutamine-hydrolysing)